ncbi:MAG: trifunctional transcriptional regulator/proline dehydrogenase/L-glutamate gamma-semialdehyde dehydrogenase [Candidatus Dasytiphilus stammeri]
MITLCVKLNKILHNRINTAAQNVNCTSEDLIKQAILNYLDTLENETKLSNLTLESSSDLKVNNLKSSVETPLYQPFHELSKQIRKQSKKRDLITLAWTVSEQKIVPLLLEQVRQSTTNLEDKIKTLAVLLVTNLRNPKTSSSRIDTMQKILHEFSLSSPEGISLMCLAEALLRIPDKPTRDALIRDKIGKGNWQAHLGASDSLFVNATTWGLLITGHLINYNPSNLSSLLNKIILNSGEPIIRKSMDIAIRIMGKNFIIGENISEALSRSKKLELQGFRYSYDMLGEAALTYQNAQEYLNSYQEAIHAIGKASDGRGIYEGPGISIKLSALHPRYNRSQYDRIMNELYTTLKQLTLLARQYDIAINIDAEEADRLELSLDMLEKLCFEPELAGWNGIGFVIQSYQKRCPFVIDSIIDLAQRSKHRLMIRLVKGAYWDTEIKRAQIDGLKDYPVYTRKVYTDISYLACARKLLDVPQLIYPQFATHNAHTLAAIYYLAGQNYYSGQYEFQCLHGMGENLYNQIVGGSILKGNMTRPCRIYAPIGSYEKLLSYLVRRLLENGSNTSFVNRLANKSVSIEELISNPIEIVDKLSSTEGTIGLPNPKIPLPINLYGAERLNSIGINLNNEKDLSLLSTELLKNSTKKWYATSIIKGTVDEEECNRKIINPAEHNDIVGYARDVTAKEVSSLITIAEKSSKVWSALEIKQRISILNNAAILMQNRINLLISLLVREAGKTLSNAISEVREAIDFLRYYSSKIHNFNNQDFIPLGPVVCISPWNFPLAIFVGQIAAALAAGNSVLAKPAEQTPLIAAQAVNILYDAGVPHEVLQLIIGKGNTIGSALIKNNLVKGVIFTGSTTVATSIQKILAERIEKKSIPFIAETGGLNTMIVDSSALTEQVVLDIITSAFDSAGQRCSALRLLCVQEDVAEKTLNMLQGAITEYNIGNPDQLNTDIGPVINMQSKQNIELHIQTMKAKGFKIYQPPLKDSNKNLKHGIFVPPTLIEISKISDLQTEVFGPILHIVRFSRKNLSTIIDNINASGYGLTMGIHTRIDDTMTQIIKKSQVGNLYVNRNIVGAVVGVQPFGGQGLSGTGPKAGGPLYLYKLLSYYPEEAIHKTLLKYEQFHSENYTKCHKLLQPFDSLILWAKQNQNNFLANLCKSFRELSISNTHYLLPGPTGEKNTYSLLPRKGILCLAENQSDLLIQLAAIAAVESKAVWLKKEFYYTIYNLLPTEITKIIHFINPENIFQPNQLFDTVLYHGDTSQLREICIKMANKDGSIIPVYGFLKGETKLFLERFILERTLSINTTAVGGNTSLITLKENN